MVTDTVRVAVESAHLVAISGWFALGMIAGAVLTLAIASFLMAAGRPMPKPGIRRPDPANVDDATAPRILSFPAPLTSRHLS